MCGQVTTMRDYAKITKLPTELNDNLWKLHEGHLMLRLVSRRCGI